MRPLYYDPIHDFGKLYWVVCSGSCAPCCEGDHAALGKVRLHQCMLGRCKAPKRPEE